MGGAVARLPGRAVLPGVELIAPPRQGALDTLCGLYAILDALRLKLARRLCALAAELTGLTQRMSRPFARQRPSQRAVLARIDASVRAVLISLDGTHAHYSVVCGVSATGLRLFDSDGLRRLGRDACGIRPRGGRPRHVLAPRALLVLRAVTPKSTQTAPQAARMAPGARPATAARRPALQSRFRRIEAAVSAIVHGVANAWAEAVPPSADAAAFAEHAIYVICNSGMHNREDYVHRALSYALRRVRL